MKRETQNLKKLLEKPQICDESSATTDRHAESPTDGTESVISESASLKSGIWPSNSTSPSSVLLSQYSMLGANSLSEWQKALEVNYLNRYT
jgi:hypothetical protein